MNRSSRFRVLGLTAVAALTVGGLATMPASAQTVNQYAYHNGYSDHTWGYGGYYDGYVGSRGAYNDTRAWQRGYAYPPSYYPSGYGYGYGYPPYSYEDGYYPYGYATPPGIGVQVGPVGIGLW
jgi:hypothetical protein